VTAQSATQHQAVAVAVLVETLRRALAQRVARVVQEFLTASPEHRLHVLVAAAVGDPERGEVPQMVAAQGPRQQVPVVQQTQVEAAAAAGITAAALVVPVS